MGIFRKSFAPLAALCVSCVAQATTQWSSFTLKHQEILVRVIYPSQSSDAVVTGLISRIETALAVVEQKNQGLFESSFELMFDDIPASHNGLATVVPRNFIWVHTVAPYNNDSIGVSKDYLQTTLIHEFGHMFYLQKRRGVFRLGQKVFGNLSSPLGSWPRWMHEGWATWVEGRFAAGENGPYLNFLKRSYAESAQGHPKERLTTSMLEGSYSLDAVDPGEIPYAFGYGLVDKIFKKMSPDDWAQSSALSLGLSFRKTADKNHFSMEELFAETESEWRSVALGQSDKATQELLSDQSLYGLSNDFVLAQNEDRLEVIELHEANAPQTFLWRPRNWHPSQLIATSNPEIVLAAYYTRPNTGRSPAPLKISLMRKNVPSKRFDRLCTVFESVTESIVALHSDNGKIYASLTPRLPTMDNKPTGRDVQMPQSCSTTVTGNTPLRAYNTGLDSTTWQVRGLDEKPISLNQIIAPSLENLPLCRELFGSPVEWCVSAIHSTNESRNPIILAQLPNSALVYKTISVVTGAQETALTSSGLVWIEKRWKHDLLQRISLADLKQRPTKPWNNTSPETTPFPRVTSQSPSPASAPYSPWTTLRPHYWMPRIFANNSGMIVSGSAWFHDITRTYEGNVALGFDTVSRYPNFNANLSRKLDWTPWGKVLEAGLSYHRDVNLSSKVDMTSSYASLSGDVSMGPSHSLASRVSLAHRWTSINSDAKQFLIPAAGATWRFREAPLTHGLDVDNSKQHLGFLLSGRYSWINNYETYAEAAISNAWPLSWLLHFEYGKTSTKNLPYSYFQWGGYYPLNLTQSTFLSRGFAPLMAPAITIGRAALTSGWEWSDHFVGLGWARLGVERITQEVFAETVSFERALNPDGYKVGDRFYSTIGTEVNFWARSLFYVKSRAFVGLYRGFGVGGETRVAIGLASNLDI